MPCSIGPHLEGEEQPTWWPPERGERRVLDMYRTDIGRRETLPAWRPVRDALLHRRVHLLRRDQHNGLKLDGPGGVDHQGGRRSRDAIRHVRNDEKIVAPIGIIKDFEGASESLNGSVLDVEMKGVDKSRSLQGDLPCIGYLFTRRLWAILAS